MAERYLRTPVGVRPQNPFDALLQENHSRPAEPRVGGLIEVDHRKWEAYTGGSNRTPSACIYTDQRRPVDYKSMKAMEKVLSEGIKLKLADKKETKSTVTLPAWFKAITTALELNGLDTIFRVPLINPDGNIGPEVYLTRDCTMGLEIDCCGPRKC